MALFLAILAAKDNLLGGDGSAGLLLQAPPCRRSLGYLDGAECPAPCASSTSFSASLREAPQALWSKGILSSLGPPSRFGKIHTIGR
ncbi:hypothetical protein PCASD_17466 [Puccinia coronata f. sp. avenae]|uniref:Uncharacterized protein n=1 Tax=Puccinia coronata f. sp. avenae TaxID=200324 RepID=A0A2N5TSN2_9BASI|nr:hypothetical protein PCASD_17466 [Puccinia coronata f. sp. avenae]